MGCDKTQRNVLSRVRNSLASAVGVFTVFRTSRETRPWRLAEVKYLTSPLQKGVGATKQLRPTSCVVIGERPKPLRRVRRPRAVPAERASRSIVYNNASRPLAVLRAVRTRFRDVVLGGTRATRHAPVSPVPRPGCNNNSNKTTKKEIHRNR